MTSLRAAVASLLLLMLVGCDAKRTGFKPPCGEEGRTRIELGRPLIKSAGFTTTGGDLYFTAYDFGHGAVGQPDVGSTTLYVGRGQPKGFPVGSVPEGTQLTLRVVEDDFVEFELEAGSYWVISTNDATLALVGCEQGSVAKTEE
jgi:hypothetical protein